LTSQYSSIQGSYKLSATIVKKLTQKKLTDVNGKTFNGASKLMISCMIYFSHICSPKGHISDLKITDLSLVLNCDKRSTFNVLRELEMRGFIKVSENTWNGYRDIIVLENDYSNNISRYLNTNFECFDYRALGNKYDKFMNLSLYAMRLLLLLLLNYNEKYGYRVSCDTLCAQLGIKRRSLINKYIKEISDIFDTSSLIISRNTKSRIQYGSLNIPSKDHALKSNHGIRNSQDSYYNHYWKAKLRSLDIDIPFENGTLHYNAGRICAIVSDFINKNLSLQLIENTILQILKDHGILTEHLFTDIYTRLLYLS